MKAPSFVDNDRTHYVIYVVYINKIPFSVSTISYISDAVGCAYWRLFDWDFELADNDPNDLIAHNSGSGGFGKAIEAPNFIKNKNVVEIWLADGIELKGKGSNFTLINELIEIKDDFKRSINPFEIAEIVYDIAYCPKCKTHSREFCHDHLYYDHEGNQRYKGNHKYVR